MTRPALTPGAAVSETALLAAVLDAEHAAVYAYGVLGARLDNRTRLLAQQAFDAHRVRRDELAARLGSTAPGPAAAYDVAVSSRAAALDLAVRLEQGLSVRWRDLVGGTTDPGLRVLAVGALQETAVRATVWRRTAGTRPGTVALPGQP